MSNHDLKHDTRFIQEAINNQIKRVTEQEIEFAKKRIDERKNEIITGVILYVEKQMRMQTIGEELIITIKTDPNAKN